MKTKNKRNEGQRHRPNKTGSTCSHEGHAHNHLLTTHLSSQQSSPSVVGPGAGTQNDAPEQGLSRCRSSREPPPPRPPEQAAVLRQTRRGARTLRSGTSGSMGERGVGAAPPRRGTAHACSPPHTAHTAPHHTAPHHTAPHHTAPHHTASSHQKSAPPEGAGCGTTSGCSYLGGEVATRWRGGGNAVATRWGAGQGWSVRARGGQRTAC